jgi:hypothetical protein
VDKSQMVGKPLDLRLVAATLAAALIRPGMSVAEASEIYFDCLHALKAGRRHREKKNETGTKRQNGQRYAT